MAKKSKEDTPNVTGVANRDIIQRLNFLYQASTYLNHISAPPPPPPHQNPDGQDDTQRESPGNKRRRKTVSASDLSRAYVKTMKVVGQKAIVRMDPAVKRTLCKGCNTVLVPGSTANVRVRSSSSHGHIVVYTCLSCTTTRRLPAPPTLDGSLPAAEESMSVDNVPGSSEAPKATRNRRKKKQTKACVPPLFERDVGHVVFRGYERLIEDTP
ncbi:hypothetical protein PLICRDRAFT_172677 [Plicaturopsis crispa FD-325 SS-3]|nr:hypothetical protein PLICRDRAFT_172677 [Plicaturopsis crispa FD-325 SS-3]